MHFWGALKVLNYWNLARGLLLKEVVQEVQLAIHRIQSRYVGPTSNSAYLNDYCLSQTQCVVLPGPYLRFGGYPVGGVLIVGCLMGA